jgi:type IV pilus assembly protein PilE
MKTHNHLKGFTLMELMITVVIVSILASIAYPAYQNYLYRTRRADGQAALMNLSTYMEHYYTENNTYASATLSALGLTNTSQQGYYTVAITSSSSTAYTLTATPVAPQTGDTTCPTLTLTNTNIKGPSLTCWQ